MKVLKTTLPFNNCMMKEKEKGRRRRSRRIKRRMRRRRGNGKRRIEYNGVSDRYCISGGESQ